MPSIVPEEPTQKRKASIFTDLLTRNRKASAVPSETAHNPNVYTVPEGSPRARKGSTFTDLLSRNKKASVQENTLPKSISSFRKASIIMEEVRSMLTHYLCCCEVLLHFILTYWWICLLLSVRWSDWSAKASHPADCEGGQWHHDWRGAHPGPTAVGARKTPLDCGICHRQTWPEVTQAPFENPIHRK